MESLPDYTTKVDALLSFLYDTQKDDRGWINVSGFLVDKEMATSNDIINIFPFLLGDKIRWIEVTPSIKYQLNTNFPWSDPRTTQIKARLTQAGIDEVIRRRTTTAELILKQKQNDSFDKVVQSSVDSASAAKASAETAKSASKNGLIANGIIAAIALVSSVSTCHMAFKETGSQNVSTSVSDSSDTKNMKLLKKEQESIVTTTAQVSDSTTAADSAQVKAPLPGKKKGKNDEG